MTEDVRDGDIQRNHIQGFFRPVENLAEMAKCFHIEHAGEMVEALNNQKSRGEIEKIWAAFAFYLQDDVCKGRMAGGVVTYTIQQTVGVFKTLIRREFEFEIRLPISSDQKKRKKKWRGGGHTAISCPFSWASNMTGDCSVMTDGCTDSANAG
jgi:hypothetical protein